MKLDFEKRQEIVKWLKENAFIKVIYENGTSVSTPLLVKITFCSRFVYPGEEEIQKRTKVLYGFICHLYYDHLLLSLGSDENRSVYFGDTYSIEVYKTLEHAGSLVLEKTPNQLFLEKESAK